MQKNRILKRLGVALMASTMIGLQTGKLQAQGFVYDGFAAGDYAAHANFGTVAWDAGEGWGQYGLTSSLDYAWGASTQLQNLSWHSAGLSYLNLATTPGAAQRTGALSSNTGNFAFRRFVPVDTVIDGSIYFSYIYQQSSAPELSASAWQLETDSVRLTSNIDGIPKFMVRHDGSNPTDPQTGQMMLTSFGTALNSGSTTGLDLSQPIFVVGVITQDTTHDNSNNVDTFTVYFNPSDLSDVAGTAAATLVINESAGNGFASWDAIGGLGFDGGPRDNIWDEFRIAWGAGASIDDVVPVIPEPSTTALIFSLIALGFILRRRALNPDV